jgi:hypothetical protein
MEIPYEIYVQYQNLHQQQNGLKNASIFCFSKKSHWNVIERVFVDAISFSSSSFFFCTGGCFCGGKKSL